MNFKKIFKENILFIATLLTIFFLDRYAKITAINILENKKNIYINDYGQQFVKEYKEFNEKNLTTNQEFIGNSKNLK